MRPDVIVFQPQDAAGQRRLAGAGLADEAEALAARDLEADILQRGERDRRLRNSGVVDENLGDAVDVEKHQAALALSS